SILWFSPRFLLFPLGFWSFFFVPPVFVQKGKDVLLDVDNVPEDFILFVWKFEKDNSILVTFFRYHDSEISPAYTGRSDHPEKKKYSVILKNLQETDSRVYSGRLTTDYGDSTLVQHNIIVQGEFWNQSKITNSSSTLQVYLLDVTVICKHRNQVSSTEDRMDIQHIIKEMTEYNVIYLIIGIVCLLLRLSLYCSVTHTSNAFSQVHTSGSNLTAQLCDDQRRRQRIPIFDRRRRGCLAGPLHLRRDGRGGYSKPCIFRFQKLILERTYFLNKTFVLSSL
uniref:Immunoglobulin V-set domain-containing protein n=1 Tax=Salarias fasciatus TaxID=181472 RepID=A0A672JSB9_SALFA